jgi:hypothetical protein
MRNKREGGNYIKTSALQAWETNEKEPQLLDHHSWDFVRKVLRKVKALLQDLKSQSGGEKHQMLIKKA